jgi:hypothetical protein
MAAAQMTSNASLREALEDCVPQLHRHCRDPWVVIGSAAAALAGADVSVNDVDLLTSVGDAERLKNCWHSRLNAAYEPDHAMLFRSCFARFDFPEMPVEVMGGLELYEGNAWVQVHIDKVVHVECGDVRVPIPARDELIRLLERFARPKDLQRSALLRALGTEPPFCYAFNVSTDFNSPSRDPS